MSYTRLTCNCYHFSLDFLLAMYVTLKRAAISDDLEQQGAGHAGGGHPSSLWKASNHRRPVFPPSAVHKVPSEAANSFVMFSWQLRESLFTQLHGSVELLESLAKLCWELFGGAMTWHGHLGRFWNTPESCNARCLLAA